MTPTPTPGRTIPSELDRVFTDLNRAPARPATPSQVRDMTNCIPITEAAARSDFPAWDCSEAELEAWVDSYADDGFEGWDGSGCLSNPNGPSKPGSRSNPTSSNPVAWYDPITVYGAAAGIFITARGIAFYTRQIHQKISTRTTVDAWKRSRLAAIHMLLSHEAFHHDVEWHAITLGATSASTDLYGDYSTQVYEPARTSHPASDLLEESLAAASEYRGFYGAVSGLSAADNKDLRAVIMDSFRHRPEGYRQGAHYVKVHDLQRGKSRLAAAIHQTKLVAGPDPLLPQFSIRPGRLHKYFRAHWVLVIDPPSARRRGGILSSSTIHFPGIADSKGSLNAEQQVSAASNIA